MIIDKGIKIQNIYYMLTYAFSHLKSDGYEQLASEDFENTADLLSAILAKGIALEIKRGLGKEYLSVNDSLSTLRGKIDITQSIKGQTILKKQLICDYDEFSINTKLNQILKTAVQLLLREKINEDIKKELKRLIMYFKEVDILNPYTINWNIRFHRNNQSYQMLISICYLVINGLLQKDEKGDMKMEKFLDEQSMHRLYEKFILEYYKKHFPQLNVSPSRIPWQVEDNSLYLEFLPIMQSDILITTKTEPIKTLIIDAKYYTKSMQTHYEKKTFHSNNLYQIFTYVKNADAKKYGEISGMLLYAKTNEEITPSAEFNMSGNRIKVQSLDLNKEFHDIRNQLESIVYEELKI